MKSETVSQSTAIAKTARVKFDVRSRMAQVLNLLGSKSFVKEARLQSGAVRALFASLSLTELQGTMAKNHGYLSSIGIDPVNVATASLIPPEEANGSSAPSRTKKSGALWANSVERPVSESAFL